ncbi:hypothetical protein GOODEAATRI_014220 [Goodea atripinnis]|uniref:Uncharacterized protein n=1 Tax=Goodea atripinnis TaxID=208336 RepID=A0ABV0MHN7_9TELE
MCIRLFVFSFYRSDGESLAEPSSEPLFSVNNSGTSRTRGSDRPGLNRSGWRLDRDMGLMNAIGLQPRNPAPSVTSQGTQTPIIQLQNAETQTERDLSEPGVSQQPPSTDKHFSIIAVSSLRFQDPVRRSFQMTISLPNVVRLSSSTLSDSVLGPSAC